MSEQQTDQPQATPSAKPKYKLDDAGVLSRVVGENSTAIAIYREEYFTVTMLDGMAEFERVVRSALQRMGKKVEQLVYQVPCESPAPVEHTPTVEPPTEPHLGERTPAWLAWCKSNQPERYAAVCKRLKISDQPET